MKSKHKITLKVLFGYLALGVLAAVSGWLVFTELESFTNIQKDEINDQNKILQTGSLIADIYENESLARAAIQINSTEKFQTYVTENKKLMQRIDSLNILTNNDTQKKLLDSIKIIFDRKLQNTTDLKRIKENNTSDKSISQAIQKLSTVYPIIGRLTIEDFVENPSNLDERTKRNLEEYVTLLNKHTYNDTISRVNQKQIDSIVTASRLMLENVQKEISLQRINSQLKEQELLENDSITSKQLRNLLVMLESEIVSYAASMNKMREVSVNNSKNIILLAAIISFIIIIVFSVIILNDFGKNRRYRQQLEKANAYTSSVLKSREQLISMVSHDLRTPLSTITGYSELLQKSAQNSKDGYYIHHIKNASTYMTQLVEDLLDFSKLEDGNVTMESVPFNLKNIIEEVISNVKTIYSDKPINIRVHYHEALSKPLISDPLRIKQILYNLIGNAYKFTEKGNITITTELIEEKNKPYVKITVKDTGIGIDDDQQKTIFKAFTQADNGKKTNQSGFGLGLTISKKLTQLLGGTLTLQSQLNEGSSFYLKLPATFSDKDLKTTPKTVEASVFNLKAVIVDDDATIRQLLTDILKQSSIQVVSFDNAKDALKQLESLPFDFIITDIQLPKMNGFHFMEIIKQSEYYVQQPIIAMTGRADLNRESYLESGFSEVIFKPFSPEKLVTTLKQFFPDKQLKIKTVKDNLGEFQTDIFSVSSLGTFLNNDEKAIKSTLKTFASDTKDNLKLLKNAIEVDDRKAVNNISHKMLSMFKLLKVNDAIPHLETLAHTDHFSEENFIKAEKSIQQLLESVDKYLS